MTTMIAGHMRSSCRECGLADGPSDSVLGAVTWLTVVHPLHALPVVEPGDLADIAAVAHDLQDTVMVRDDGWKPPAWAEISRVIFSVGVLGNIALSVTGHTDEWSPFRGVVVTLWVLGIVGLAAEFLVRRSRRRE